MDGVTKKLALGENFWEVAEDRDGGKKVVANVIDYTCQSLQGG